MLWLLHGYKNFPYSLFIFKFASANTKTFLILQAHFSRLQLPCSDYYTDTKSVLDQTIRILQAMIDVCAENGWLASTLRIIQLMQMVSFEGKVEIFLKGSLDLIPSPSPWVKIQIMGGKVCLMCKDKTLLGIVNKLLRRKSLLT